MQDLSEVFVVVRVLEFIQKLRFPAFNIKKHSVKFFEFQGKVKGRQAIILL